MLVLAALSLVFEGGNSDNECSGGFGSSTVRPKGSTKAWSHFVQLGSDYLNHLPSVTVDNGVPYTNITARVRFSPWRDGRFSPPVNTTQSEKTSNNSLAKPLTSTSSSKRTSLWGLTAVTNNSANSDVNDSSGRKSRRLKGVQVGGINEMV